MNSAFVQRCANKNIDPRTAARLPQTLAVSVLTERGREEKGRGEELMEVRPLPYRKKKESRCICGVVCMVICSIIYAGPTLPTGDI